MSDGPDAMIDETSTAPVSGPASPVDAGLAHLTDRPLAEHPDVYRDIYAGLQSALAEIDDA